MSELAENLLALNLDQGLKSPRSRGRSPRSKPLKNGPEPMFAAACYEKGYYYRGPTEVKASVRPFLDGTISVKGHHRRANCASFPKRNGWVDAVTEVANQTGLSAAEAAALLKRTGQWPTGSAETAPSRTREYRRANRVKSPSRQQRSAPVIDVTAAVQEGERLGARRGLAGIQTAPISRQASRQSVRQAGRQSPRQVAAQTPLF